MAEEGDVGLEARIKKDVEYKREAGQLIKSLRSQAVSNIEYFQGIDGVNYERFYVSFARLVEHLEIGIEPGVNKLLSICHLYDIDAETPANGYRSFVHIALKCCRRLLLLCRHISVRRDSFLFRASHYSKELSAYVEALGQLRACLYYLQILPNYCEPGHLFADSDTLPEKDYNEAEGLMLEVENLSQEAFYGRCLGFQYCESMVRPLSTIILAMASFADGYEHNAGYMMKVAKSLLVSGSYYLDPESRAKKIVNVTRNGDVNFCKAFWSIAENNVMHSLPLFVCPNVQVDKVIVIQPDIFELPLVEEEGVMRITPPCAHHGPAPVNTRLLSYKLRRGQETFAGKGSRQSLPDVAPMSDCLIIQCHGGGFVAQSSASHEVYLRSWAKEVDVPILAIDYSLAPESPFPRQLEEAFFAYCWAVKNAKLLGSRAKKICVAGDSAGANLVLALTLRAISYGIRVPDGVLSVYGTTLVKYTPSPARIMSLMDPLLPIGVMSSCLAAYAGVTDQSKVEEPSGACPIKPPNKSKPNQESATNQTLRQRSVNSSDSGYNEAVVNDPEKALENGSEKALENGLEKSVAKPTEETKAPVIIKEGEESDVPESPSHDIEGNEQTKDISCDTSVPNGNETPSSLATTHDFCMRTSLHAQLPLATDCLCKSASSPQLSTSCERRLLPGQSGTSVDTTRYSSSPLSFAQIRHFAQSPMQTFHQLPISKNFYMSPYLAPDQLLLKLPPVYFVACHLDPMLDDSVMFAKKLKKLQKETHIDVLEDLPHGFLNFTLLSHEARHGSEVCIGRLKDILGLHPDIDEAFEVLDEQDFLNLDSDVSHPRQPSLSE